MAVAVQQPNQHQKRDPLDTVLKGLQIAGAVYGIKEANVRLDEHEASKKAREDQSAGVISPQDEASLGQKGFLRVPQGTENAVAMKRSSDGSQVFFAPPKPKAELITPYQQAQLDLENKKLAATSAHQKQLLASAQGKEAAKAAPKDYNTKLQSLNASEKARFDNVRSYSKAVDDLEVALVKGGNRYSLIGDNDFTSALDRAAESFGRMQSGGAINKDEEARFINMIRALGDDRSRTYSKVAEARREADSRFETLGFSASEVPEIVKSRKSLETAVAAAKQKGGAGEAVAAPMPKQGHIEDGYEFIGGNPSDPKSWKKK